MAWKGNNPFNRSVENGVWDFGNRKPSSRTKRDGEIMIAYPVKNTKHNILHTK